MKIITLHTPMASGNVTAYYNNLNTIGCDFILYGDVDLIP
jgi:hypothetical protein